tara:strand:- start:1226 stop:2017 length:792 start_codon:yes stop_codon:yes gene_type:complete
MNDKLVNKFFKFETNDTSEVEVSSEVLYTEPGNNSLWDSITMLKRIGEDYHTDGAELFADNCGTKFEKEFELCLEECGIEKRDGIENVGYTTTQLKSILKQPDDTILWKEMEDRFINVFHNNNIFIPQPAGGKHEPDFMVYYNRKLYLFECKKRENGKTPIYGDNGCHPKIIYLFKSKWKRQLTHTYWLGSDLISQEEYLNGLKQREDAKQAIKDLLTEYPFVNNISRLGTNQKVSDVLGHPKREVIENNVQNYILGEASTNE